MKRLIPYAAAAFLLVGAAVGAQGVPPEYQQVLTTLSKTGDYKANVLKVNIFPGTISASPSPTSRHRPHLALAAGSQ